MQDTTAAIILVNVLGSIPLRWLCLLDFFFPVFVSILVVVLISNLAQKKDRKPVSKLF